MAPEGESLLEAIAVALAKVVGGVGAKGRSVAGVEVVVSTTNGVPSRSGTSVWEGPAAGGGTGRPPPATVVAVVRCVVVVRPAVVGVVELGGTGAKVVVVVVGVVVVVCAITRAVVARVPKASAPRQTEMTRRTRPS